MAKFHFKYGAMNSGKTDTLIKTAYNYTENNLHPLIIKSAVDTKGQDKIISRTGFKRKVDILAEKDLDLEQAINDYRKTNPVDVILVDEVNLMPAKQVEQLYSVAKHANISVICYGLLTNFLTHLFPGSKRAIELADNIEKIPTMCVCGSQAEFNVRLVDGKVVETGEEIAIDGEGSVSYVSRCGKCRDEMLKSA